MPSISKRIRDIKRLLSRPQLTEEMKGKLTNDLHSLKSGLKEQKLSNKQINYSVKYHRIKFFERKKLTRHIRRIEKQLSKFRDQLTESSRKETDGHRINKKPDKISKNYQMESIHERIQLLENQRTAAYDDLAYVLYYPKDKKYISLFVSQDDQNAYQKSIPEDKKTLENQQEARKVALQRWKEDQQEGNDLVQHAVQVEYQPVAKSMKISKKNELEEIGGNEDEDIDDESFNYQEDPDDKDFEEGNFEKEDLDAEEEDELQRSTEISQSSSSKSGRKRHRDNEIFTEAPLKRNRNAVKNHSSSGNFSQGKNPDISTQNQPIAIVDDPFFVEPVSVKEDKLAPNTSKAHPRTSHRRSKKTHSNSLKELESIPTDGMTKQELRLLEWKKKQARKKHYRH